jgi:hypothetical protein
MTPLTCLRSENAEADHALPMRDELRQARIRSEQVSPDQSLRDSMLMAHPQRRRNELREGFKRLSNALPPSNQRSSKSSLLERCRPSHPSSAHLTPVLAVVHIQQIVSANNYLVQQLEKANAEVTKLQVFVLNLQLMDDTDEAQQQYQADSRARTSESCHGGPSHRIERTNLNSSLGIGACRNIRLPCSSNLT